MSSNSLVRMRLFARPHARGLALSLAAGLAMMGSSLPIPALTGGVVDEVRAGRSGRVLPYAALVVVMGALETAFAFLRRYTAARASIAMEEDVRNAFYAHLQRLPVAFHDGWQSGQLLSRAMGDISTLRRFIGFGLPFFVIVGVQFIVVATLMFRLDAGLALFTALMALPIMAFTWRFDRAYYRIARRVQDDQGDLATVIEECATGIRIVKAFGRGPHMSRTFRAQADTLHDSSMQAVRLRAFFWSLLRFAPNLNLVAVLAVGGYAVTRETLTLGGITTFISYLLMLTWPIRAIGWLLAMGEEARSGAARLFEVLDTRAEVADRPGAVAMPRPTGHVRFEGVGFRYPGTAGWVLRGLDLEARPGETLAIVGLTGSGKTSVVSLVPRLYDPTEGRITIDGTDLRDVTLGSLREHVGVAFEDPILFSMSVRENLLLGSADATEDEMRGALETAKATFVYDLPWGLDTRIGEQGHSLSGGQRQRLALARAVIGRPAVLVLDDPLSAVDVHTEAEIEHALESVLRGVTAILVVHRPSTLALADRVALLEGGRIAALGTHSELLASEPLYRAILSQRADEPEREEVAR